MGSKTRLGSYCTKRANNGVNLVTSRNINTRLARPIDTILCDYASFHFGSDLMHRTTKIAQIETLPVCIEQCIRTGSKPARRVFLAPRRVADSVHATYGSTVSEFFTPRIFDAERQHL